MCGGWRRTVLEPQLPEEQGTLEDVTSARLVLPRHQHQVGVDEDRHLQGPSSPGRRQQEETERGTACQRSQKAGVFFGGFFFEGIVHTLSTAALSFLTNVHLQRKCERRSQASCALRCPVAGNACARMDVLFA